MTIHILLFVILFVEFLIALFYVGRSIGRSGSITAGMVVYKAVIALLAYLALLQYRGVQL